MLARLPLQTLAHPTAVQAGSWQNLPGRLLSAAAEGAPGARTRLAVRANPRNWGGQELLEDVVMGSNYSFEGSTLVIDYSMEYRGRHPQPRRMQELPAFFVDRRLSVLALYEGDAPWSGAPLRFSLPRSSNTNYWPSERWAAYIDPESGAGIGVFVPLAERLTAYRVGPDNSSRVSDTSYLAPLARFPIRPNSTTAYRAYVSVGRLQDIRAAFARLAARHGLANSGGGGGGGGARGAGSGGGGAGDPAGRRLNAGRPPGAGSGKGAAAAGVQALPESAGTAEGKRDYRKAALESDARAEATVKARKQAEAAAAAAAARAAAAAKKARTAAPAAAASAAAATAARAEQRPSSKEAPGASKDRIG
jgi:hypothetical protein